MTMSTTAMAVTLGLAIALCLSTCQCTHVPQSRTAAPSPPVARGSAFALGYENDLVEFDLSTGRTLRRQALDARPATPSSIVPGHYMAFSPDGQTVYSLIRRADQAATVVALDRRTFARRWSAKLPAGAGSAQGDGDWTSDGHNFRIHQ